MPYYNMLTTTFTRCAQWARIFHQRSFSVAEEHGGALLRFSSIMVMLMEVEKWS